MIAERTGKSLRGPARDVLLSGATDVVGHGWGFGLHTALDQTGAVLGPLFIAAAVARSHRFGPAFLWLAIPGVAALAALAVARALNPGETAAAPPPRASQPLPRVFWIYAAAAGLLACRIRGFSAARLSLSEDRAGAPRGHSGAVRRRHGGGRPGGAGVRQAVRPLRNRALTGGILVSLLALPLGFLGGPAAAIGGVACWAAGLGAQDGCLRAGIAQVVSMNKRGGAFGAFNAVYGVMWFLGSAAMGLLYDHSVMALVVFGVVTQCAAAAMFFRLRKPLAAARAANSRPA